eukprot:sb/3472237/
MTYRARAFEAYAEQKWDATRKLLQASMDNYAFRKRALSYCIQTCSSDENYDVDLNKEDSREYFQTGDVKGQIEAGEAFYLYNPSNVAMYNRLKKLYQDNGMSEPLQPANRPLYHEQYTEGVAAYTDKDWPKCSYFIEQSIATYLKFTDMCRVRCTYPYDKPAALSKVIN